MLEAELSPTLEMNRTGKGPVTQNRWLQRTLSNTGQNLGQVRDKVFALAKVERHDLVLDVNAGTGLLMWEAVRRAAAGGVWALAAEEAVAQALKQQVNNLDELERPVILTGVVVDLHQHIAEQLTSPEESVAFDVVIGRNVLTRLVDKQAALEMIARVLKTKGRLVLAETVPRDTQRLHQLVDLSPLDAGLVERIIAAEESIYTNPDDPMVNWAVADLEAILAAAGFSNPDVVDESTAAQLRVGSGQIERWFAQAATDERPTYGQHLLKAGIESTELEKLKGIFRSQLEDQVVNWQSTVAFVVVRK